MAVLVVFLVLLFAVTGISQSNNHVNDTNIPILTFCGQNALNNLQQFNMNRKSTFDDLRMKLLTNYYARAQNLGGADSIYAMAQCRNYLSVDQCVACFDVAVSVLVKCRDGNGAFVLFDNCFIRYEDFVDFYNNPDVTQDGTGAPFFSCGNQSSSQPISTFNQVVDGLLSDIRDATPKTPNLYVASKRQIGSENSTVYVIAQCVEIGNKANCRTCMDAAYDKLNDCLPNTEGRYFNMGCFARYSSTSIFNDNQTIDITNILKGHSSKITITAGAISGVLLFFLVIILWLFYRRQKKSNKAEKDTSDLKGAVNYNYKDLQLATKNFSEENILGKGGFGEVYMAVLDDKNVVAVKRLHVQDDRAKEEFENEVKLISNVHHRNLLRLLGWSSEGSDLLLVLEYMPNGSLDRFLWGAKKGSLDWNQRYEIIFGIARGLVHLHNEFHVKIIHRDIKSSNILLSEDYKPKIADFGLARFHPEDQSHVSTKFAGTMGYTAPEYILYGFLSDKVDTYSFGVVILEIISGRKMTDVKPDQPSTTDFLLEHAWKLYEMKQPLNFIDETLDLNQHEKQQVTKIIEIALWCTQTTASDRPTMSEVVLMLQDDLSLGRRQLTRPTFVNNQDRRIYISSSKKSIGSSINVYNQRN